MSHLEYQPDCVVETAEAVWMLEPKAGNRMDDPIVLSKKEAAVNRCINASRRFFDTSLDGMG